MNLITALIQNAVRQGVTIFYGAAGEILTEKSGNLNLGVPGMMYMGGIGGLMGAYWYESTAANPNAWVGMLLSFITAFAFAAFGGLIYSFLTITLHANQNVTGLALSIFGVGFGNFFGGSLSQLVGGRVSVALSASAFKQTIPFLSELGWVGDVFFSYGMLTYLALALAVFLTLFFNRTRAGLNLRAVGESPATADAAGVSVTKYKYLATVLGGGISGLGGLYFVMDYAGGTWSDNGLGDRGWLAVALVIFALWKPLYGALGSVLFGGLYIVYLYVPGLGRGMQEIFKMLPYVVTVVVLILTSMRKKKENQPPESLGNPYFREER